MGGQLGQTVLIFPTAWLLTPDIKRWLEEDLFSLRSSSLRQILQAIIQFAVALVLFQTIPKGMTLDKLSISPAVVSFISLLVGEIGRKHSRVNLLKLYLFGYSVATLVSVVCLLKNQKAFELIKDFSRWEVSRLEVLKSAFIVLGILTQMYAVRATTALIHNMAPPKSTS